MNKFLESEEGLSFHGLHPEMIVDKLFKDCAPWIKESQGGMVYRGMSPDNKPEITKLSVRQDRKPMDTPEQAHDAVNGMLAKMGFTANRTNSIFVTGNYNQARGYGIGAYIIFPIGSYSYTWGTDIVDMYKVMTDNNSIGLFYDLNPAMTAKWEEIRKKGEDFKKRQFYLQAIRDKRGKFNEDYMFRYFGSVFSNRDLLKAIESFVEIMVHTDYYYAISDSMWNIGQVKNEYEFRFKNEEARGFYRK